jgi:HAD superfamily hydrolase (TIGR01484 family)
MRYRGLACDYDGTIAWNGKVSDATIAALESVRASGRKLLLVTGRELDDLARVFPRLEVFDRIVAENGALLYHPETHDQRLLGRPPQKEFAETLQARGAERVSVGRVIVATCVPYETIALEIIREMGLEHRVIFNKGAVMILPPSVDKGVGFLHALADVGLSPHDVAGVGDAENDLAFLTLSECAVAVSNALDSVKARADWVTNGSAGDGVQELIRSLLETDLKDVIPASPRRRGCEQTE